MEKEDRAVFDGIGTCCGENDVIIVFLGEFTRQGDHLMSGMKYRILCMHIDFKRCI